jgi:hypothetical protein
VDFPTQLDYTAILGKTIVPNAERFNGHNVVFTGEDPYALDDLVGLLSPETNWFINQSPAAEPVHTVVIGQVEYAEQLIQNILGSGFTPPRFAPQEGFLDELLFGHDWWSVDIPLLNNAAEYHEGLKFVKSLGWFPWPGTEVTRSDGSEAEFEFTQDQSFLYVLGYSVRKGGPGRRQRWIILQGAVRSHGLQAVSEQIASAVRLRAKRSDATTTFKRSIEEWRHDLGRLRKTYFDKTRTKFRWPRA